MKLRTLIPSVSLLLSTFSSPMSTAFAQGTAFTYQGQLNNGGGPASGLYDFRFRVSADPFANNYLGSSFLTNGIPITNGLFTATMDFGTGIFAGSNLWLEIAVRTNGDAGYTTLAPLQPLTPAPYAIFANTASNLSGTVSAAQISGTVPSANLSGTYTGAVAFINPANSFSGNGTGLTINPSQILDEVSQLPLSEWSYKCDPKTRHLGPMGQDFYAAFKVGTDEKHIAPIDEGGVALAAIQGLNEKVEAVAEVV